ncbi:ring-1,2-phenylacetyl-CoA epoxidase subunit PaaD [Marininema mesophilum]|uniref:Ring-1,2-phenylacetyl-CoA epoxidase subunit PaaD n=1 Tax=Marininema mesophilum TaxID=1048340 RepID=A0A1H3A2Q7_9BACL|nr:1,2-phenylacetyl-CoA epoxidase subunit PaaD [Marininema mesophilum]SDX23947.1 ring-1,2-phenylacetyl-CoA epoxidase subunit PaaD [Marininema mesophilum]
MTVMIHDPDLIEALQDVKDPEIPAVSIVELGIVNLAERRGEEAYVELTPTFVGCPALDMIRSEVEKRLAKVDKVEKVSVQVVMNPPWTSDRITQEGRKKLTEFGIAPPLQDMEELHHRVPACPYCGEVEGDVHNLFGPTACRAIYYCRRCKEPFEGMKPA